jgi:hypothetical protein
MSALRDKLLLREAIREMLLEKRSKKAPENKEPEEQHELRPSEQHWNPQLGVIVPWPEWVKTKPDGTPVPWAPIRKGTGPGEQWVARVLEGKVMGGGIPYDIDSPWGKFEVKEPKERMYGAIRAAAASGAAIERSFRKVKNAVEDLVEVFGDHADPRLQQAAQEFFGSTFDEVYKFVNAADKERGRTQPEYIFSGEMGKTRIKELTKVLKLIAKKLGTLREEKYIELGDTETDLHTRIPVEGPMLVRVAKMLDLTPDDLRAGSSDIVKAALSGEAFVNPEAFVTENLVNSTKPGRVFNKADGLVLVREDEGFIIIPRNRLDELVEFIGISQGQLPTFKLKR